MEKKLYQFYYVIAFLALFSCQEDISNQETKNNQKEKFKTIEKIQIDSIRFIKKESAEMNKKGIQFIEDRNFTEAKKVFVKSLKIEPKNAITFNNLALIASNEGDFELANSYFKKSIYYDSSYFPAYINFSSFLIDNDYFKRSVAINDYILKMNKDNEFELMANYFNTYAYLAMKDCAKASIYWIKSNKNSNLNKNIASSLIHLKSEIEKCQQNSSK